MIETHHQEIEAYILKYHCYYAGLGDIRKRQLSWAESRNEILQSLR